MGGDNISDLYYSGNPLARLFNSIGRFSHVMIVPFVLLYIFRGYKCAECSKKFLVSYLIVFLFNALSIGLTTGSRANLFFGILNLSFFFILFWNTMSYRFRRKVLWVAVAVVAILFVVVAQITEERFGENVKRTAVDSIYEYLGETFPVLGYEYWDKVNFTGGKRLFSEFFSLFDSSFKAGDKSDWYHYTGVRVDWFKTVYGDLYIEFGPVLPVIILFILKSATPFPKCYLHKEKWTFDS